VFGYALGNLIRCRKSLFFLIGYRQQDAESRSLALSRAHLDAPSRIFNNIISDGKAKPSTLVRAFLFGAEKGIEYFGECLVIHADPIIFNFYVCILADGTQEKLSFGIFIYMDLVHRYRNQTLLNIADGILGIYN